MKKTIKWHECDKAYRQENTLVKQMEEYLNNNGVSFPPRPAPPS